MYPREKKTTPEPAKVAETCEYCGGVVDAQQSSNASLWASFAGECFCVADAMRTKKHS
jgi:hypothetical protein